MHPLDVARGDPERWSGTYLGGAGIVDALRRLGERGLAEIRRDYLPYLEGLEPDMPGPSLMLGETGILLVRHRLSPSPATEERLRALAAANAGSDARELLLGSPGTMLVAHELGLDDLWQTSTEAETARRYALAEGGLANWPPHPDGNRGGSIRTQWCHGPRA